MAELICIRGEVALVDAEDLEKVAPYRWRYAQTSRKTGKPKKYVVAKINGCNTVYLHRFVMDAPKGIKVDHRDGDDTLNCQKANLRLATDNQNAHNRTPNLTWRGRPCASKFKGVSRQLGKWRAAIGYLGVIYRIGAFESEIEAAEAYDDFAYWLHKEFALRNFPDRPIREFKGTLDVTRRSVRRAELSNVL